MSGLPPLRTVRADGRAIAYREAGSGAAVVLLHGIGSSSASWEAQLAALSARYRAIAWDAPGYGGSDPLPDPAPSAAAYGDAVAGLIDALGLDKVHVLGHSMGAPVAASFCRRHPGRVLSVVLGNPARGYLNAPAEIRTGKLAARLEAIERLGPERMAAERAREVLSPNAPASVIEAVQAVMSRVRPDGYVAAARMLDATDIIDDAREIAAPALVIGSDADTVTPEKGCRRIADAVPGARYVSLEGIGHASYAEGPEAFNAALMEFLEAHG